VEVWKKCIMLAKYVLVIRGCEILRKLRGEVEDAKRRSVDYQPGLYTQHSSMSHVYNMQLAWSSSAISEKCYIWLKHR
jgi:hypothetical protein